MMNSNDQLASTPGSGSELGPEADENTNNHNNNALRLSTNDDANDTLLCLNFNQDGGCLAVGTAHGFRICNTVPFQETFRRRFVHNEDDDDAEDDTEDGENGENKTKMKQKQQQQQQQQQQNDHKSNGITTSSGGGGGGIGGIEMLFRCNLLALVGGGNSPQYQKNKVLIWDDHLGRPIGELSFRHQVLAVKLRRDRICVALRDRVYVYNFGNLALLDTIVTGKNDLGLLCISTDAGSSSSSSPSSPNGRNRRNGSKHTSGADSKDDSGMVLACPSVTNGQARVELYGKRKTLLIDAHEGALAAMALTVDGSYLATASERGTIVRLFSTVEKAGYGSGHGSGSSNGHGHGQDSSSTSTSIGVPLREFRRGVEQARIGSLSFSLDKCWLACASDRGTVHVFRVEDEESLDSMNKSGNGRSSIGSGSSHVKKEKSSSSFSSSFAKKILPSMLTKSPRKYLLEGENSYVQVRGITHPKTCAFVPDRPHTIAVAGLDDFGNGCLLLASFGPAGSSIGESRNGGTNNGHGLHNNNNGNHKSRKAYATKGEAQRVAYHRFFKKGAGHNNKSNGEGNDTSGRQLMLSDINNEEDVTNGVEEITFGDDADGFVSITADQKSTQPGVRNGHSEEADEESSIIGNDSKSKSISGNKKLVDNKKHLDSSSLKETKEKRKMKPTSQ